MRRKTPRLNHIYVGDAAAVLRRWPAGFDDLCVTSPPYFQLRDYGHRDQIGRHTDCRVPSRTGSPTATNSSST